MRVFFAILTTLLPICLFSKEVKSIGIPFIQNYTKETYRAENQNWCVSKDANGIMYYGNTDGLLKFDGRHWQLYPLPNKQIVRAVACSKSGKVYVGGFGEMGFWQYDQNGIFTYTSLVKLVPRELLSIDEIWKIYITGNRIIFQSFTRIYIYENEKISVVDAGKPLFFSYSVKDRFFVEVISQGLFELKNNKLAFIEGSQVLGPSGVLSILPFKNNSFLIGTAKNGLFIYDGKQFTPWQNQASEFLRTSQLNNGVLIYDRYYAYGTILNGIVILNDSGKIVQRINKATGLQNNTVLSLYADEAENLWLGLDKGIDRVELNSGLYYYLDKNGVFGTVYTSAIHNGRIYLGTNQGLFSSHWEKNRNNQFKPFDFKLINNSQGQIWTLALIDGQLICGQNEKTYLVKDDQLIKIADQGGGWIIKKLNSNPDVLIQGTYTGLVIYKKDKNGVWAFSNRIQGFNEPARYTEQDQKGNVWVGHPYRGLFKLTLSDDLISVRSSKYYSGGNGLPPDLHLNALRFNDQVIFSSEKGFYTYEELIDKFIPYEQLNKKLGSFGTANNIIKAEDKKYWFINHGRIAMVDFPQPDKLMIDSTRFSVLEGRMVSSYENINKIDESIYLISMDDGFAIYDSENKNVNEINLPKTAIGKITNITDKITTLSETNLLSAIPEIPYSQGNISISYSLPYYQQADIQYQYYLEGYSKQWSDWTAQTRREFTNLSQGHYRFIVKAKVNQEKLAPPAVYEFIILPPWYATIWAYIGYCILAVLIIMFIRYLHKVKLLKQKHLILQKLELEKEEFLKKEQLANEQRIAALKTQQLEADLAGKKKELANSTMNIVYKNELLQKISEELLLIKDKEGKAIPASHLKKIQTVIEDGMTDERDWHLFEESFDEAHEQFFKKLKNSYPDLSLNDLKLCAYLKMNMSSKELVSILNITLRGVEIRRYRLRKKLNLDHDTNLVEFLMGL